MSTTKSFTATIEDAGGGGGAYVRVPFDVEKVFGVKRLKAVATIDGEPYRGSVVRMGSEQHILIVLKGIRETIGKTIGDDVSITLREDTEPRVVDVPADMATALRSEKEARAIFDALSYTHKREYVMWIEEAKRPETRANRIIKAIAMLREGKRSR
jgi:hypothetical protein